MCVTARVGGRAAHETQSISNYFGTGHEIAALRQATPPELKERWRHSGGSAAMKHKISATTLALAREIAVLQEAAITDLKDRWRVLYGTEPPRRISRDLLIRALAYRIQEQALGGLKPSTRRLLTKIADDASARRPIQVAPELALKPGTVLLREWHGTQHQVIVREDGIVLRGKPYKSLSEVAYRITGAKWSGPRFFGLKTTRRRQTDGTI
jgi:hypothetical protein